MCQIFKSSTRTYFTLNSYIEFEVTVILNFQRRYTLILSIFLLEETLAVLTIMSPLL